MTKSTRNSGKHWTPAEKAQLRKEAAGNTPTRVIGVHLGRTPGAIYSKASELGITLDPHNVSPYGTPKKR